ncbi:hypothetical protein G6F65_020231 [Rhizopus arrhizus]|nr:hypothetical protein G6F65_020231 [Rhizopus arrhizus]
MSSGCGSVPGAPSTRIGAARLRRDVAGRIAPAHPVFQRLVALLGHDLAAVVGVESVRHDAVETRGAAHFAHGAFQQALDVALVAHPFNTAVDARRVGDARLLDPQFQFDDRQAVDVAVADHVTAR